MSPLDKTYVHDNAFKYVSNIYVFHYLLQAVISCINQLSMHQVRYKEPWPISYFEYNAAYDITNEMYIF